MVLSVLLSAVLQLLSESRRTLSSERSSSGILSSFFLHSAPVSIPVLIVGLITCVLLEKFKIMGYGAELPVNVRRVLEDKVNEDIAKMDSQGKARLVVQGIIGILLIISLALHVAEVGVIGLMIIVLLTAFNGVISEHQIGHAFEEALPFTALLVVFFAIVAVIHDQHLFNPVINYVLSMQGQAQLVAYYIANGVLSAISDNVFVATVYINETATHFKEILPLLGHTAEVQPTPEQAALITQYGKLAVAINMGTNIPSVATPNGQAAFLFLLTSALAPLIRLSYMEMVKLAFPYTITMSIAGFFRSPLLTVIKKIFHIHKGSVNSRAFFLFIFVDSYFTLYDKQFYDIID